jgi:hypothetical protein
MTQDPTPQEALASIAQTRSAVADRLTYPLGQRLLHAGLMTGMVGVFAVPASVAFPLAGILAVGVIMVARRNAATRGWQGRPQLSGAAMAAGLALGLVLMGLIAVAMSPRLFGASDWTSWVAVVAAFPVTFVANGLWMRAYRRAVARGAR